MTFLCALLTILPSGGPADSARVHNIAPVVVSASIKHNGVFSGEPVAVSAFTGGQIEAAHINETKDLSLTVPNFIQADYGSKMTSSIYIRGIGSRMEQPAMGLYVDNIPILNKNNYDIDYYDIDRLYVLRGPQGTLYGRNTMGGVIDMHTLSPMYCKGTNIYAAYGSGNSSQARVSTYQKPTDDFGISVAFNHMYSDGFFTNEYDGSAADRILSESGRVKAVWRLNTKWTMENTLMANYADQKGFAYSPYDERTGEAAPINHNDPCTYERTNVMDGLTFRRDGERYRFSSTTSYQFTGDEMVLDQDFSPASMFTLRQTQVEHAATQELVLRTRGEGRWQWITGLFGFYKHNDMEAPVVFKRDGIDQLILANANEGIHKMFPDADLEIEENSFTIESAFEQPVFGVSAYHQSTLRAGRWNLTAGIRADYEHTAIEYDNSTAINYRFTLTMDDYKPLPVAMEGQKSKSWLELLPHVAVAYDLGAGTVYASVSRGYKSGGYNTQIFSDVLQNKMMTDLTDDLGIYPDGMGAAYNASEAISYKPEYSWNYEVGTHLSWLDERLNLDAAMFYIDLHDQQLTVFPPGQTTGRMMSNAGRSRSFGAEISLSYRSPRWRLAGSYGYTDARFTEYVSGDDDYAGRYVPYVPRNTVSATCQYRQPIAAKWADDIVFNVGWQGAGRICWNEANTAVQPFYGLLNASVAMNMGKFAVSVWGKNLADADYNTFYFKSIGNSFVQRGKPVRMGLSLNIKL